MFLYIKVAMGDPHQEKVRKYPFMSDEKKLKENLIQCFPKDKDAIESFFKLLRVSHDSLENETNLNLPFTFAIIILVAFPGSIILIDHIWHKLYNTFIWTILSVSIFYIPVVIFFWSRFVIYEVITFIQWIFNLLQWLIFDTFFRNLETSLRVTLCWSFCQNG